VVEKPVNPKCGTNRGHDNSPAIILGAVTFPIGDFYYFEVLEIL